jgi:hypothetical protein
MDLMHILIERHRPEVYQVKEEEFLTIYTDFYESRMQE